MWEIHKGDVGKSKELVLTVKRTSNKFSKTELDVSFAGESSSPQQENLVIKGCPFQKSCTIYSQDSIVAQVYITNCKCALYIVFGLCLLMDYVRCSYGKALSFTV